MTDKHKAIALADALEQEFGWLNERAIDPSADPTWREEPLPLNEFVEHPDHLSGEAPLSLYPEQRKDLEAFLGTDPKIIFDPDFVPEFNQAFLIYGKGCLGEDEQLVDHSTGQTRSVKEWAEIAEPLLILSWDGRGCVLTWTTPVYKKGTAPLFRVTLADGRSFVATDRHRCFTPSGWLRVGDFAVCDQPVQLLTESGKYEPVESVQAIGVGDFYDLTVPLTGCYFDAQGILHHNSGKDTIVSFVHCWITHILLCLHSPQAYLGLPPGESIDLPVIGYSENQAKNVYFAKFKARIKSWKWLKRTLYDLTGIEGDRYLKEGGEYVHTYDIEFPHAIRCWSLNSSLGSSEGKNVLFWVLDELAAFTSPVKMNLAKEIHNLVVSSARSRFKNRWRGFAISFPRHKQDYMMGMAAMVQQGLVKDTLVSIKPTWTVVPHLERSDFDADFARDPEDADTKYGCNPPSSIDSYFRSPHLLLLHASGAPLTLLKQHQQLLQESFEGLSDEETDRALERLSKLGQNPITQVDRFGDPILDYRGFPKLARWFRGQRSPSGEPYEYYAHLDPGLGGGDAFGFAMGHLHELPDGRFQPTIDLAFRWTGRMFRDFGEIVRPAWFSDTVEQRQTIVAAEVDFRTVREFLFFLKLARGFEFELVSYDGWNSAESIQALRQRDIPVATRIVSKGDYDIYKELVYSRQLCYYAYPVLIEESLKLQLVNGTKVEAPRTIEGDSSKADSHKDVSDAVAAVCRRLVLLKDESVEFAKFPPPETWWDRAIVHDRSNEPGKSIAPHPDKLSEMEQAIWNELFGD